MQESSIVEVPIPSTFNRLQSILAKRRIKSELVKGNASVVRFALFKRDLEERRNQILRLEIPQYMISRKTHIALNKNIEENKNLDLLLKDLNYSSIIVNNINILNTAIENLKRSKHDLITEYFIAGSAGWNNLFKTHYDNDLLSEYEKSAIHITSYDLYYFINKNTYQTEVYNLLRETSNRILDELNYNLSTKKYSANIRLSIEIKDIDFEKYVIFPSKRIAIKLEYIQDVPPRRGNVKNAPAKPRNVKKTSTPAPAPAPAPAHTSAPVTTRSGRVSKPKPLQGGGSKTKTIFSLDLCFSNNDSDISNDSIITNISNNLIMINQENRLNYLNLYGTYIFIELYKKNTFLQNKGYNHFKVREYVFNSHILKDDTKSNILFNIAMIYYNTFFSTYLYNKDIFKTLLKLYMTSIPEMDMFINTMEANIIEIFRPYINQLILNINRILQHQHNKLGIFIAGGDATRRYKNDISITKDIDTKIYIPKDLEHEKQFIETNVINELIKLCSYLINNRLSLFNEVRFPYDLYKETRDTNYEYSARFIINEVGDDNLLNFRFRQIFKGNFPVDLLSLDYRCKIIFTVKHIKTQKEFEFQYKYDIAFLDVVLEVLNGYDNYYEKYSVLSNNRLPVCGLDFLLKDLQNTYTSETSSLLRFLGSKNHKDYNRYIELNKILFDGNFSFDKANRTFRETSKYRENTSKRAILDAISPFEITADNEIYILIKRCYDILKEKNKGKKIALSYNKLELNQIIADAAMSKGGALSNLLKGISRMQISNDTNDSATKEEISNDTNDIKDNDGYENNISDFYNKDSATKEEIFNNFITIDRINTIDNQIFKYYNNANYFFKQGEKDTIIEYSNL